MSNFYCPVQSYQISLFCSIYFVQDCRNQISALTDNFDFFNQICPKREILVENGKIVLVGASIVVTYYIKLFRTGADRHSGILMSLILLVAETINVVLSLLHHIKIKLPVKNIFSKHGQIHGNLEVCSHLLKII